MVLEEARLGPATLDVSPHVLRDLRAIVAAGIYRPVEDALREQIVVSGRRIRESYHTMRGDGRQRRRPHHEGGGRRAAP